MICSVPGCSRPSCKRSLCNAHYIRLRRYGNPLAGAPRPTVEQRFWAKVDKSGDCWVWTAKATSHGAGWFKPGGRGINPLYAYRFSYELLVGPVPDGMELDHQCHNRLCVRPDHLRPVSHKQNLENRSGPARHSISGVSGVRRVPIVVDGPQRSNTMVKLFTWAPSTPWRKPRMWSLPSGTSYLLTTT